MASAGLQGEVRRSLRAVVGLTRSDVLLDRLVHTRIPVRVTQNTVLFFSAASDDTLRVNTADCHLLMESRSSLLLRS